LDLFNASRENLVFESRETLRRLLVASASIAKYIHLVPEEQLEE